MAEWKATLSFINICINFIKNTNAHYIFSILFLYAVITSVIVQLLHINLNHPVDYFLLILYNILTFAISFFVVSLSKSLFVKVKLVWKNNNDKRKKFKMIDKSLDKISKYEIATLLLLFIDEYPKYSVCPIMHNGYGITRNKKENMFDILGRHNLLEISKRYPKYTVVMDSVVMEYLQKRSGKLYNKIDINLNADIRNNLTSLINEKMSLYDFKGYV